MNDFQDILICCDIDGTLIDDDFTIPQANFDAIELFRQGGGQFTLATGRTNVGAAIYLRQLNPDTPIVCQNGTAIYDCKKNEYIWICELPKTSAHVIEYICEKYPQIGVELMSPLDVYCSKFNSSVKKHETDEKFTFRHKPYQEIHEPWLKIVFAGIPQDIDIVQHELEISEYASQYNMSRSFCTYYEIYEKTASKAKAVAQLADITSTPMENLIVIGDNDNDCEMLSLPCLSLCPSSASPRAKECADIVLDANNNSGVLPEVLRRIAEL